MEERDQLFADQCRPRYQVLCSRVLVGQAAIDVENSRRHCAGAGRRCRPGCTRGLCPGRTGRRYASVPGGGVCLGARILGGPCLGGRLLASRSARGGLCSPLWLASLVIAGVPPGRDSIHFPVAWAGGTRGTGRPGRACVTCALLFGQKIFCENAI